MNIEVVKAIQSHVARYATKNGWFVIPQAQMRYAEFTVPKDEDAEAMKDFLLKELSSNPNIEVKVVTKGESRKRVRVIYQT